MSGTRWAAFVPRDTLVVRDGRAFDAGSDDGSARAAETVRPWPSSIAGSLTTAINPDDGATMVEPDAVRGPVLALRDAKGWMPHFTVPADLLAYRQLGRGVRSVVRLQPSNLSGVTCDLADHPVRFMTPPDDVESAEPLRGLVPSDVIARYLADDLESRMTTKALGLLEDDPFVAEDRVGLARVGRVAREGYLFSATHLRARAGWALLAECVDSMSSRRRVLAGSAPLGGKSRLVDVELVDGVDWPSAPESFPGGRVLLYVVTPAIWPGGWKPPLPRGVQLVGACVPQPVPVATASPRKARVEGRLADTVVLRWAVPAGAVYLLRFEGASASVTARTWAHEISGSALGPGLDPSPGQGRQPDRTMTAGFGVVLAGRWAAPDTTDAADAAHGRG